VLFGISPSLKQDYCFLAASTIRLLHSPLQSPRHVGVLVCEHSPRHARKPRGVTRSSFLQIACVQSLFHSDDIAECCDEFSGLGDYRPRLFFINVAVPVLIVKDSLISEGGSIGIEQPVKSMRINLFTRSFVDDDDLGAGIFGTLIKGMAYVPGIRQLVVELV
jgi:hypothetical protein